MSRFDLVIKSDKIFIDGRLIDCYVGIKNGIIVAISKEKLEADEVIDAEGKMVLPGTVDPHVHIRAPGHDERAVSYTHLRAHETRHDLVCRLLLEKKKKNRVPYYQV